MSYRWILGTGTMAKGADEAYSGHTARLEDLPIKDFAEPRAVRRFGRLTKMIFIAAHRALKEAAVEDPSLIPMAVATCIGETHAALGILEQIHQTRGVTVSPALVPNSVHNAAAGYLSIGLKNHQPVLTVSQGRLSAESAVATALDMLEAGFSDRILIAAGDEADPSWVERLQALGDPVSARQLDAEAFEEGAAALVLGVVPGPRSFGALTAGVERWDGSAAGLHALFLRQNIDPTAAAEIRLRKTAEGERLKPVVAEALGFSPDRIILDKEGEGTAQTGPLLPMIEAARNGRISDLLLLGAEADEVGYIYWKRDAQIRHCRKVGG